ncbi:uncharacterized protein EI90DRAFT_3169608 [Cantharellus anzutake]|uniref:uncharacterized protein n=1 Tax=Cantharellus anzutake TaxID=1750568 RepID=UPI001907FC7C|nr:uncharacterized protein EI90DRAFT_3169608 [Cantharellus anzutake]KAF8336539.1 hypothetical protein EI90DRAFT_3169608 [Cantharellus anzutake]
MNQSFPQFETTSQLGGIPKRKLSGHDFYRHVLGNPKYIVAPMVEQSELAWRILSRRHGAQAVYTPMINSKLFTNSNKKYILENFNMVEGEEGGPHDRPLVVQFCGNDPNALLAAAKLVEGHCDAVDINLGCPQEIARRGKYGAFLQDDWALIYELINTLHLNLEVPVTAKFVTVEYAKMLESAGAQVLTCHGRIREQRGQNCGLADWSKIRAVKEAVSVPVVANGNILYHEDIHRCLEETGADGVMSAEGNLYNPGIFDERDPNPPHADLALEYLDIVHSLNTVTSPGAIRSHLFKLLRPSLSLERNRDLRDHLGKIHADERASRGSDSAGIVRRREDGLREIPHWLAQPYIRLVVVPVEDLKIKGRTSN